MRKAITNLDLLRLIDELKVLIGCRVDNIYNKDKELRIKLLDDNHKRYDLKLSLSSVYLTKKPVEWEITNFAMILRKYMRSKKIISIEQYKFDRILEMKTEDFILIVEMFHNGNIILTDTEYTIIMPLELQRWKTRSLIPKEQYKYPESIDIRKDFNELRKNDKKVVALLVQSGFGKYAEEILEDCSIDKDTPCKDLNENQLKTLETFIEIYLSKDLNPNVIKENDEIIDFSIFSLRKYMNYEKVFYPTISECLDEFFVEVLDEKDYILESQEKALKEMENNEKKIKEIIEYVNNNYDKISEMQETLKEKINIEGFEIDKNIPLQKNLSKLYQKSKKLKLKIENLKKDMNKKFLIKNKKSKIIEEKKWFHKYYHITTSDGFLVVAGKDARSNEDLIKKHLESNDVVFHAEIHGASFVVIKIPTSRQISNIALEEAAQYSAVRSKAWAMGLGSVDVYWVKPNQLVKSEQMGSLGKGSFLVEGEKNYCKNTKLEFGVGIKDEKVISGPYNMIKKVCKINCLLVPGSEMSTKIFEKIRSVCMQKANEKEREFIKSLRKDDVIKKIPAKCNVIIS